MPQLAKCILDLMEVPRDGLTGSPECAMHHSEPLVMAQNMKKHGNLLFHRGVDAVSQKATLSEPFDKFIEGGSTHPKHLDSLYLVVVVDVVQISNPLLVSSEHRPPCDQRSCAGPNYDLVNQENPGLNHCYVCYRVIAQNQTVVLIMLDLTLVPPRSTALLK